MRGRRTQKVTQGMFDIYQDMLGVNFTKDAQLSKEAWAPEVTAFKVGASTSLCSVPALTHTKAVDAPPPVCIAQFLLHSAAEPVSTACLSAKCRLLRVWPAGD